MNWDAIGAVGEVIGAAAVVFSLIYLAIQVKQNREATERNTRQMRNTGIREIYHSISNSPELSSAWVEAESALGGHSIYLGLAEQLSNAADMPADDALRVIQHAMSMLYHYRTVYHSGLSEYEMKSLRINMRYFCRSEVAKLILNNSEFMQQDDFFVQLRDAANEA